MSTNIFNKKQASKGPKPVITSTVIIVLIIIVGISVTSYFFGKKQANDSKSNSPIPIADLSRIDAKSINQKILGEKIYNWTGKIKEIKKSSLIVSTSIKNMDGSYISKDIVALIDKNTIINRWDLTVPPTSGKPNNNKTEISYGDLDSGNRVIIKSSTDLDSNYEVTATDVSLLITPN